MQTTKLLVIVFCVMSSIPAGATEAPPLSLTLKSGTSLFLNGQSNVLEHRLKPSARIELMYHLYNELEVGLELTANWDKNENYRLIGGYLTAQVPLYSGSVFSFAIRTGWGIGTGPRILYTDLMRHEDITLWAQGGVQMRWLISDLLSASLDLTSENLSMVTLNAGMGFHF